MEGMKAALTAALVLFGLNFALGVSLQLGSRWHVRWLHHALYTLTCLSTALAALLAWRHGSPWWPLALVLAALLLVPRTHPGRADHALLACAIGAGFALSTWGVGWIS